MQALERKPLAPERAPKPTLDLLTFTWRYVLGKMSIFVGLSGALIGAVIASSVSAQVVAHIVGIETGSSMGSFDWLRLTLIETALTSLVIAPIWAGLYGVVFKMLDNDPQPMSGFSVLQQRYQSIVMVPLLVALPTTSLMFVLRALMPGELSDVIGGIFAVIVGAAVVLAIPALVRYDLKPLDAILYSVRRFGSRPLAYLGFYIGTAVLSLSGLLACGVGVLLTLGVWFVAPALLMLEPRHPESEARAEEAYLEP